MRRVFGRGCCLFVFFALIASNAIPALAATQSSDNLPGRDELNIGIPDFPRRIVNKLPELKPNQELNVGFLKLHPSYTQQFDFDDNITLAHQDEKEDFIVTEKPAVLAEMKLGDHRIEGGYGAEFINFAKDSEEDAVNHLARGLMEFNFSDLHLSVEDVFEKTTSRLFNESSARDRLLLNTVQLLARYDRPRWAAESGWTHNTIDHTTPEFKSGNYNEDILAFLGGYKFFPKTLFLGEFDLGTVYYDRNIRSADQKYYQILGGLRGEITSRLTAAVKGGVQQRFLEEIDGLGEQTDFAGPVADADFTYRFTPKDTFRGGYIRTVKTSPSEAIAGTAKTDFLLLTAGSFLRNGS